MMESGGRPEGEVMDVARRIGNQQVIAILEGEGYELPPETVSYYQKRVKELQSCFAASYGWGKEAFGILLSAPSCKVHSWNLTYLEIDHCESAGIQKLLKKSGVTDRESFLQSYENRLYRGAGKAYEDFASFWKGEPQFDLAKLGKKAKQEFQDGMEYAANFNELVKDGGFYAWDYAETIALVRMAFTCGLIDKEEGLELLYRIVDEAKTRYDSWRQYAISYICGGAYTYFQNSKRDSMQGDMAFKSLSEIVQSLFEDKVWSHGL